MTRPADRPTQGPERSSGGGFASTTLKVVGWAIVAGLGLVVVARAVAWDKWILFAELDAAVEVLFLPAWLVLVGALIGKKWWMAGAAALLCVAQVIYVAPEVLASSPVPAAAYSEPTIHLFDANVQSDNYDMAGYIEQLRSDRPDLVTLEETHGLDYEQFLQSGVFKDLPYRFTIGANSGSRGFIIASRYPLGHGTVSYVNGLAYMIRFNLQFHGRICPSGSCTPPRRSLRGGTTGTSSSMASTPRWRRSTRGRS